MKEKILCMTLVRGLFQFGFGSLFCFFGFAFLWVFRSFCGRHGFYIIGSMGQIVKVMLIVAPTTSTLGIILGTKFTHKLTDVSILGILVAIILGVVGAYWGFIVCNAIGGLLGLITYFSIVTFHCLIGYNIAAFIIVKKTRYGE